MIDPAHKDLYIHHVCIPTIGMIIQGYHGPWLVSASRAPRDSWIMKTCDGPGPLTTTQVLFELLAEVANRLSGFEENMEGRPAISAEKTFCRLESGKDVFISTSKSNGFTFASDLYAATCAKSMLVSELKQGNP